MREHTSVCKYVIENIFLIEDEIDMNGLEESGVENPESLNSLRSIRIQELLPY